MASSINIYIESDNQIKLEALKLAKTGAYINDATVIAHVVSGDVKNPSGQATSESGGAATGIPMAANIAVEGEQVFIIGTKNHDGIHNVLAGTTTEKLIIDHAYVEETFNGKEEVYQVVMNCGSLAMTYEAASNGDYYGNIPDQAVLYNNEIYFVFIQVTNGDNVSLFRNRYKGAYL